MFPDEAIVSKTIDYSVNHVYPQADVDELVEI